MVMNPKYLWEGRQASICETRFAPIPTHDGPGRPLGLVAASPTYLLFFGWYPQKEMFFSWKKWLHLFPYRRHERRQSACRGGGQGGIGQVHREGRGPRQARTEGEGDDAHGARRLGLEGSHLGLLSIIGFDTYLDTPDADLKDAAGGWVKVHGEPAGGGDLQEGQSHVGSSVSPWTPHVSALPRDPIVRAG